MNSSPKQIKVQTYLFIWLIQKRWIKWRELPRHVLRPRGRPQGCQRGNAVRCPRLSAGRSYSLGGERSFAEARLSGKVAPEAVVRVLPAEAIRVLQYSELSKKKAEL